MSFLSIRGHTKWMSAPIYEGRKKKEREGRRKERRTERKFD